MRQAVRAALLSALLLSGPAAAFEVNGHVWPQMPVQYRVNPTDCPAADGLTILDFLDQATAAWSAVACADVSFQYMGATDATWANDGQNTIYCVNKDWKGPKGAAGATLWLVKEAGEPQEVDLALNAADFKWVVGGGDGTTADIIDPQSVITHELGHWLGLSHSPDPFATMYFASLPGTIQATLDADDKAGLCTLYPNGSGDECAQDVDCGPDATCQPIAGLKTCGDKHGGPGEPCDKWNLNCDGMCWVSFSECTQICLFTTAELTAGYCSPLCDPLPCPDGFACTYIPQYDVSVCFLSPASPEEGPDAVETPVETAPDAAETVEADASSEVSIIEPLPDAHDLVPPDAASDLPPAETTPADDAAPLADAVSDTGSGNSSGGGCTTRTAPALPPALLALATLLAAAALRRRPQG